MHQPARREIEPLRTQGRGVAACPREPAGKDVDVPRDRLAVGRDELRGTGRRRRADVGDEVADREVGLVAHGGDDRQRGVDHRARDLLVVERPQVLDRAAAPSDDQHVDLRTRVRRTDRLHDARGRGLALHGRRVDDDAQRRPAARERRQHVVQRRALWRRHQADRARIRGQRPLALGGEPARGLELRLEPRELLVERSRAGEPDRVDVELEVAARLVDRRRRAHLDGHAVRDLHVEEHRLLAPQDAAHLRLGVLEREVAVPRGGSQVAGDLPRNPHGPDRPLDREARARHEQAHRKHGRAPARREPRGTRHRGHASGPERQCSAMRPTSVQDDRAPRCRTLWPPILQPSAKDRGSADCGVLVQAIDAKEVSSGESLGIASKTSTPARLSARMYKICTPVSTGFVDNAAAPSARIARKALPDAGFGGVPPASQCGPPSAGPGDG